MAATTEYWVNDSCGQPVLVVTGELTEKLEQAIEELIIPELKKTNLLADKVEITDSIPTPQQQVPACTLIFDREGYHPAFFKRLWEEERIAIITYRKNVQDNWDDNLFTEKQVDVLGQQINMNICEQKVTLDGVELREIRRRKQSAHQTSIITNNYHISTEDVAGRMFGRWTQENFFKYLIADYDFDKMITYGVAEVDQTKQVVNPLWRKADYKLKKQKEKASRLKAKLYSVTEELMTAPIDTIPTFTQTQIKQKERVEAAEIIVEELKAERDKYQHYIKVEQMQEGKKYQKLKPESKLMINVLKMICYRAETSIANLLAGFLPHSKVKYKRALVKQIIEANADLIVDEKQKTLTVQLHSLSANRFNEAAGKLAELLSETETVFPGSDLRLIFKNAAI